MVIPELLELVDKMRDRYNVYRIDAAAEEKESLHSALAAVPLRAIELSWTKIKETVAWKNQTFKLDDVNCLLCDAATK